MSLGHKENMKITLALILYPEGHASHQGRGIFFSLPSWEG